MIDVEVVRSWPGVTNGQLVRMPGRQAERLIAAGMARRPRRRREKKAEDPPDKWAHEK